MYTFEIKDNGIFEKSKLGDLLMSWNSIVRVHKRKDRTCIERAGGHWAIILKKDNEEHYDNFIRQIIDRAA